MVIQKNFQKVRKDKGVDLIDTLFTMVKPAWMGIRFHPYVWEIATGDVWEYSPPIPKEAAAFSATPPPSTCPPACCILDQGPPQRSRGAGRLSSSAKLQHNHI